MRVPSSLLSTRAFAPRRLSFLVVFGAASAALYFLFSAGVSRAAPAGQHGLKGYYYVSDLPLSRDFQLPEPLKEADGTRVDSNIAFGQGQGFRQTAYDHLGDWANLPALGHPNRGLAWLKGVVWRGFIHLPKAGTYYFATVSHGSSAVYLNQARVALNGGGSVYGALINSDAFAYDPADIKDYTESVRGTPFFKRIEDAYAFPVTVSSARDLPIEVRYGASGVGVIGIDLLWTTPDSPRDASGKPILKIVPSEALYTEAQGPIEQATVRSANSTISADLYCAGVNATKPLTLSFRLADRSGHPVAGKQVLFTTLADDKFGFDDLVQPDKPTDEHGITTAQLKSKPDSRGHVSSIYALDVTDLVEIGQVGHVRFPGEITGFFASPCTEGFDPNLVSVEPQPMMVGHPLTLKVKLENREKNDVDLDATFQATYWNIGANTWKDIGQVSNIHLKPAEIKDVSVVWTPTAEQIHQCFRVKLKRNQRAGIPAGAHVMAAVIAPVGKLLPTALLAANDDASGGTTQRNMTTVSAPPDPCAKYDANGYPPDEMPPVSPDATNVMGSEQLWNLMAQQERAMAIAAPPGSQKQKDENELADCFQWTAANNGYAANNLSPQFKANARRLAGQSRTDQSTDQRIASKCPPGDADCTATWAANAAADADNAKQYDGLADDPPTPIYRGLAVAKADAAPAYIEAIRVSMERYQGAQSNGDSEWMARHLTAMLLYAKRLAVALSAQADGLKKRADALPANDLKTAILQAAEVKQAEATAWQKLAESAQGQSQQGQVSPPQIQTFELSNPHDRTEDVRLTIQPMSLPSDWKLSVINAEQIDSLATVPGSAPQPSKNQPRFPIHEVTPGKEYVVSLPAGQTIKVASVLVPVGEIGANTAARWAVEGRIGNQVIGTMVHEMQAAYVIPDLKLPAIGSTEQMEEGQPLSSTPGQSPFRLYAWIAGAAALLVLIVLLLARRRRKETTA